MLAVSLNVFDSIDNIPLKIARYLIGMQITDLGSGDGCENKNRVYTMLNNYWSKTEVLINTLAAIVLTTTLKVTNLQ